MSDIKKNWKAHQFDWNTIELMDDEAGVFVCLNQREIAMILGALTPTHWRTRWLDLPEEQDLQWIDNLEGKLLCAGDECCEAIEGCIDGSEGIREIIREIIRETTICDPSRPIGGDNPSFSSCNPDVVFGAVTSLVDYLNNTIKDALEIIEIATNPLEAINLWADNIPIAGALASGLVEAIDWIVENIAENYDANYTIALRDQYRCDLFCLWINSDNCDLTPAMIAGYFAGRIGSPDPLDSLNNVLQFLFTGVWAGSQIVDTMHLLAFASLTAVDKIGFFDMANAYTLTTAVALGANNPSSDWSIICEDCVPETWEHTFDFEIDENGFVTRVAGLSIWQSTDGWISATTNPPSFEFQEAGCKRTLLLGASTLNQVTLEYYANTPKNTGGAFTWRLGVGGVNYDIPNATGINTLTVNPDDLTGSVDIFAFMHFQENVATNSRQIKSMTLSGDGANPFE